MVELSSSNFVDEIDKEKPQVTIIIHLYENVSAVISIFDRKFYKNLLSTVVRWNWIVKLNSFLYIINLQNVEACEAMNGCLSCLAQEYPTVKFCKIRASDTSLSHKFVSITWPTKCIMWLLTISFFQKYVNYIL